MTLNPNSSEFLFVQALSEELSTHELIFPTSLNATMNIRRALSQADAPLDKIARVISAEPVVSAQILRVCNSAAFNPTGQRISDLKHATMRLGVGKVRNIAITVGMKQLTEAGTNKELPDVIEQLWTRCIRLGTLCQVLARRCTRVDPDTALLAGLLHNIGTFYILNRAQRYPELFANEAALWQIVEQWHENIGAAILDSWDIGDPIESAVQNYRDPSRRHPGSADLTDVLVSADRLDHDRDPGSPEKIDWDNEPPPLAALGLTRDMAPALLIESQEEASLMLRSLA